MVQAAGGATIQRGEGASFDGHEQRGSALEGREKRTLKLLAYFENGFAKGWAFAVKECFRDALDIKLTPKVEPVKENGKTLYEFSISKNGKKRKRRVTRKALRWTQGSEFAFKEGDVIYDSPEGYLIWDEALKVIRLVCSVTGSTPNNLKGGSVSFQMHKPNRNHSGLIFLEERTITQAQFVNFLKNGILDDGKSIEDIVSD